MNAYERVTAALNHQPSDCIPVYPILSGCVTPANAVMGTDAEWDEQCRTQIEAMGKGGGFILATGCEYPANAPFDRAQRMINLARATRMQ